MTAPATPNIWIGWLKPIKTQRARIEKKFGDEAAGSDRRAFDRLRRCLAHYEDALDQLRQIRPDLYEGQQYIQMDENAVEKLVQAVCQDAAGYALRDRQHYIVQGLAKGVTELGWELPVPAPITINPVESSSATPDSFRYLNVYDRLQKSFWSDLQTADGDAKQPSMKNDAGQLLFSLVTHSAVISRFWLQELPVAIRRGTGCYAGNVWLELGNEHQTLKIDSVDRRRRQFLAPVTQLLLQRWYQRWGKDWPLEATSGTYKSADYSLRVYAARLCDDAGLPKKLSNQCLTLAAAHFTMTLPNFLVHYLRSNNLGTPIPTENWLRLLSGYEARIDGGGYPAKEAPLEVSDVQAREKFPAQYKRFDELRKIIQKPSRREQEKSPRRETIDQIRSFMGSTDTSPLLQLMAAWAVQLLHHGGAVKSRLENSSVARYLNWIRPLLSYADNLKDPFDTDEDDWQAIYDEILANSPGSAADRAGRLAEFHRFIEVGYGIPSVDIAGYSGTRQIDAKILTFREYALARNLIKQCRNRDDLAEFQELLLILGYRCGLRRGEACSRLMIDFPGIDSAEIRNVEMLVRPNKNAGIKSTAATRRIPLSLLLTKEELDFFENFYGERRTIIPGQLGKKPLFPDVIGGDSTVAQSRLFDPLTRLLQRVTGDDRFRFHHLRHSFVSFTLLRLMENQPGEHLPADWRCDEQGVELLPRMDQPFWKSAGLTDTGQGLWLVAMWAGHASPSVTLECYSHLLDWLTKSYLWQREDPNLSVRLQQVLLDKTPAALEKQRQRMGLRDGQTPASKICGLFSRRWPADGQITLPTLHERRVNIEDINFSEGAESRHPQMMIPYFLEFQSQEMINGDFGTLTPRGLEAAAFKLAVAPDKGRRWHRNAAYLMNLRTGRARQPKGNIEHFGHERSRRRLSQDVPGTNRPLAKKDLRWRWPQLTTFVVPPNSGPALAYAKGIYECLLAWFERNPDEAVSGMLMVISHAQRSKSEIRVRGVKNQKVFFNLLDEIGMKRYCRVRVTINHERDRVPMGQFWMQYFGVPKNQILYHHDPSRETRVGPNGLSQVLIDPPASLNKSGRHNQFWMVFRFALMSALVVCGDLSPSSEQ